MPGTRFIETEKKIRKLMTVTGMPDGRDRVICGLSGGADSVFLLLLLKKLSEENGFELRAVHVHHGIRGEEADRDAAFSEALCMKLGVPFRLYRRPVPEEAAKRRLSLEEAGRNARREIFLAEARKGQEEGRRVSIALAHHEDDLAESVIFRLARGSGLRGLAAMRPSGFLFEEEDDGNEPPIRLIRPLLTVSRAEIEASLHEIGQPYCEDGTNQLDDAARNRIRHVIMPALKSLVNEQAASHIASAALRAAEADDFIRSEGRRRAGAYLQREKPGCIFVKERLLQEEMPAMQAEILRIALKESLKGLKDVGAVHIRDLLQLFSKECGKRIVLPRGTCAVRTGDGIRIGGDDEPDGLPCLCEEAGNLLPGGTKEFGKYRFSAVFEPSVPASFPEKRYTKTIDYDKIKGTLVVRNRRTGDFITVRADGAAKTLSDYFTDEKVPPKERDRIPLIADGSEIVWVVGMRIGYRYRISGDTTKALTIAAEEQDVT